MLAICIYFERRSTCGRDYPFEKWRSLVRAFGVDHVYVIDRVDLPCFLPEFKSFDVIKSFDEIEWSGPIVFVDKDAPPNRETIPYLDYTIPDNALICFGGDSCGIVHAHPNKDTSIEGDWIYIPMADKYGIWAEQAAAVVLSNRYSNVSQG